MEEAVAFIREFVRELRGDGEGRMRRHSGDYDLYLPWLWEEIVNSGTHDDPAHTTTEQSRLYMEAAWSLVQQGVLRPGPPKISANAGAHDYGKGFSLTFAGEEWLKGGEIEPSLDASPF